MTENKLKKHSSFYPKEIKESYNFEKYSKAVRFLKLFLPSFACVLISFMILWPHLKKEQNLISSDINEISKVNVNQMTINNPLYQSFDKKMQPFNMKALRAFEKTKSIIVLEKPNGDLTLNSDVFVTFSALNGEYNRNNNKVKFNGDVAIFSDNGYSLVTESAEINTDTKEVNGDKKVTITTLKGVIEGKGFKITDNGNKMVVKGKAKMTLKDGNYGF
ncbi:MAG: Lipopolysaccharide-assembly, LptC-related [Alphaproteobacteria bacterium ADurb.Bin438]|nr:MAG: Lipopolysaccharide-assembly, LptC-related [Alphaproteobacteria bacterium ADurb.Bin438]